VRGCRASGGLADDEHAVAAPAQVAGDTRAAARGVTASGPVVVPGTDCKRSSPEPARNGHSSPGNGTFSGQAAATPVRWPGPGVRYGTGGGFDGCDGYLEAEGLEVADVVADLAVAAGAGVVVVRAEVVVPGFAVGEQVEDDDQDGAGDRGQRLALAESSRQAAVVRLPVAAQQLRLSG
jgi:hypothetical protein